jgi:hypothetical protein
VQVLSGGLRGGLASPLPAAVCRWVIAYVRALKAQLTEDSDLRGELQVRGAGPGGAGPVRAGPALQRLAQSVGPQLLVYAGLCCVH